MNEPENLNETLGIEFTLLTPSHVEAIMPITPKIMQQFGVVHGGATITLLEAVASMGAALMADLSKESAFGIEANVRHRKSGVKGTVRGVAKLNYIEGNKQFWDIAAYDDCGDVMSNGSFMTKIVSHERLAEIELQRAEAKRR